MTRIVGKPTPPVAPITQNGLNVSNPYLIFFNRLVEFVSTLTLTGTSGTRPAANSVYPGTIYYETNTGATFISDGTSWLPYSSSIVANLAASTLLGRGSGAGAGPSQQITLGPGLQMAGTVLSGILFRASVTLTNAQILALPSTAVTIPVPGLAPGLWVNVLTVNYSSDFTAGAYTNIDPTSADIHVSHSVIDDYCGGYLPDDAASVPVLTRFTDMFGTAWASIQQGNRYAEQFDVAGLPGYVIGVPALGRASLDNVGLDVAMYSSLGDLTGGDPANTLKVTALCTLEEV